ncbi:MAG TPA: GNAT family N-acetyltransferase [Naasia sp.]|jgi:ribosomal protein S18 acetylase RimI-like enzyme
MTDVDFARWAQLTEAQKDELASLHVRLLPWTINSQIGVQHMRRVYDVTGSRPDADVVAALLAGRVVGSASFARDHHALEADLTKRFRVPILRHLITHPTPRTAATIVDSLQVQRAIGRLDFPYQFLLTWFVDPTHRGLNIGRRLLAEGRAQPGGEEVPLVLDVNNDAESGLAAYARLGFVNLASTSRSQLLILRNTEDHRSS